MLLKSFPKQLNSVSRIQTARPLSRCCGAELDLTRQHYVMAKPVKLLLVSCPEHRVTRASCAPVARINWYIGGIISLGDSCSYFQIKSTCAPDSYPDRFVIIISCLCDFRPMAGSLLRLLSRAFNLNKHASPSRLSPEPKPIKLHQNMKTRTRSHKPSMTYTGSP